MADQGRWWKLWTTAPTDPSILALPPALRWAWAALGTYIKIHGEKGTLKTSAENPALALFMGVENDNVLITLTRLPNVIVRRDESDNGKLTVIIKWWAKYQEDSTGYARLKKHRQKQRDNGARREEKRREESTTPPTPLRGPGPRKRVPGDPNVPRLIAVYHDAFLSTLKEKPPINGAMCGKIAKSLLCGRSFEAAEWLILEFFRRPPQFYADKRLYGMNHILSAATTLLARKAEEAT